MDGLTFTVTLMAQGSTGMMVLDYPLLGLPAPPVARKIVFEVVKLEQGDVIRIKVDE